MPDYPKSFPLSKYLLEAVSGFTTWTLAIF